MSTAAARTPAPAPGYRNRHAEWPVLLNDWIEAHRTRPFAWHSNDCCSSAAAWVLMATGVDVFAVYAERYAATMPSAMRIVKKAKGLKPLVDAALGDSIGPSFAGRGDVVLVDIEGRESLAVCLGNIASGPGKDGMVFVRREAWQCAWLV